ncbi:type VI secretion system-associated FHA domain protein TagH [Methylobacterium sp. J-090]|uniref:type VI secretion system-associated FHA domain protein TagH n=1 Tax=Methylobacterium sp. J-090 TaxID=2836666 RepID=UPI001FB8B26B|nr:type VI secretion system-associated FHA domain protein TagH [Methylobacterium sp. J-090]MCJ2081708.1 type VI secretion system-associated FHA domain protein TagH [Methylobacterium sp. J-090]
MTLHLTIENHGSLPDGGPLSIAVTGRRGIDIGRDQYLDWTLPDTERLISGKHAEVRHRDGAYWINDVSRNGVYLNRNPQRIQGTHRLKDGDRIQIGHYLIVARIDGEEAPTADLPGAPPGAAGDYWDVSGDAPPPIARRDLKPRGQARPVQPDFIDWAVDVAEAMPPAAFQAPPPRPAPAGEMIRDTSQDRGEDANRDMAWAAATPPPPPPAPPPMPAPRRPPPAAAPWSDGPSPPPAPGGDAPRAGSRPPPDWSASEPAAGGFGDGRPPASVTARPPAPVVTADAEALVARFAKGAGLAPEVVAWRDPGDLAEEAGALVRLAAEGVKQLLAARAETKRAARATSQTMIQALDNNPLKFAPTVDDALRIMLGRPSGGYLDARRALETGFRDLKTHQIKTYSAMQNALRLLMDDLDPDAIAASDEGDRGLAGLLGSRKARLWDLYATRWDALTAQHEDGMIDAFMIYFADCYDRGR